MRAADQKLTPMMQQYLDIKRDNPEYILLFRLGDFYEMFFEDARLASRELDLVLTGRDCGQEERAPMCGVPHHSVDGYIARLVQKGYKVAICEQMENPAEAKGLVRREIVRVVTPGTITDESMLESAANNYLGAVFRRGGRIAFAFADVSTGEVSATLLEGETALSLAKAELAKYNPAELLYAMAGEPVEELASFAKAALGTVLTPVVGNETMLDNSAYAKYGEDYFEQRGMGALTEVRCCVGLVLRYLAETQRSGAVHLRDVSFNAPDRLMSLDVATRRNLELTGTLQGKGKRGALLGVLDVTKSAMGGRLLRAWLEQPLYDVDRIGRRLDAVEELLGSRVLRERLWQQIRDISDLQRLLTRVVYMSANARELRAIHDTLRRVPPLREALRSCGSALLQTLCAELDGQPALCDELDAALVCEDIPASVKEGGIIRPGYHAEVDRLAGLVKNSRRTLADIEARERAATGIKNLKISYNKVFGYYLEVTKSYYDKVPEHYIRKQTLVNCERFITPELKALEGELLVAGERRAALEYELFCTLRGKVEQCGAQIGQTAAALAALDVLCALAEVAERGRYCRPAVHTGDEIVISEGRHPVVETMLRDQLFVPNDTRLDCRGNRLAIITGPNMAGKSTYMRQVALIVLMAQIGSFVPAASASIGIVDQIFTRVGASDDLSAGQSTFLLEMGETANILKNATRRSLLIFDEIGRGTSTFDGMSIARAVIEYVADEAILGARTLFATHYHELTELEDGLEGVKNYNIAIKKSGDTIIFLRRIMRGGADESYGIEVARLAGVPEPVIETAKRVLEGLEQSRGGPPVRRPAPVQPAPQAPHPAAGEILSVLERTDVTVMTPMEAINLLYRLKKLAEREDGA
ncbi:MAG: DNA mismatch repair protein MutS [Clostridiales bacterium]|nr:DNA mismatch repair protein MutS [Clostridiales bacterium]